MKIEPISVTELNRYMKEKVAGDEFLNHVYVRGEISNFKNHYTGHMYFTLKDENSLIKCIIFKSYAEKLKFMPKDGMKVLLLGTVSVFERDEGFFERVKVVFCYFKPLHRAGSPALFAVGAAGCGTLRTVHCNTSLYSSRRKA